MATTFLFLLRLMGSWSHVWCGRDVAGSMFDAAALCRGPDQYRGADSYPLFILDQCYAYQELFHLPHRFSDTPHGLKPDGFSVQRPANAGTPRRRCPRHWIFLAAFSSRSKTSPQCVQTWVRTERLFWIRSPQPLQSCAGYAGWTAATRLPTHAAVQARMDRKWPHPAS